MSKLTKNTDTNSNLLLLEDSRAAPYFLCTPWFSRFRETYRRTNQIQSEILLNDQPDAVHTVEQFNDHKPIISIKIHSRRNG